MTTPAPTTDPTRVVTLSLAVITFCCLNVYTLEVITTEVANSTLTISTLQFVVVAILCYAFHYHFEPKRQVPIKQHLGLVSLFALSAVLVNLSLDFDIPMPLHIIIRSGSLLANMAAGTLLLKEKYPRVQHVSAWIITFGVILASYATRAKPGDCFLFCGSSLRDKKEDSESAVTTETSQLALGLVTLLIAQVVASLLGVYQKYVTSSYGKAPFELMFYMHAIPALILLPFIMLKESDVISSLNNSRLVYLLPDPHAAVPRLWLYMIVNVISQFLCASMVFQLTSEASYAVFSLVLLLRKVASLLLSVVLFQNRFTFLHGVGAFLVLGGSMFFLLPSGPPKAKGATK